MSNNNPQALENLPPLDDWANHALVRDLICNVQDECMNNALDMAPDTVALRDEILRRMSDGKAHR